MSANACLARCQELKLPDDKLAVCLKGCPGLTETSGQKCSPADKKPAAFCFTRTQEYQTAKTLAINIGIAAVILVGITMVGLLSGSDSGSRPP